jgi:hypothetical protein
MKYLAAGISTLVLLGLATSAAADPVIAKLKAPVTGAPKPVAGDAVFECLGDVCAARAPTSDTANLRTCKQLVREVGPVVTFGAAAKQLDPSQVNECNQSARK